MLKINVTKKEFEEAKKEQEKGKRYIFCKRYGDEESIEFCLFYDILNLMTYDSFDKEFVNKLLFNDSDYVQFREEWEAEHKKKNIVYEEDKFGDIQHLNVQNVLLDNDGVELMTRELKRIIEKLEATKENNKMKDFYNNYEYGGN